MSGLVTVEAIAVGIYGGSRRRPGDTFEVPADLVKKGTWFVPVEAPQERPVPEVKSDFVKLEPQGSSKDEELEGLV